MRLSLTPALMLLIAACAPVPAVDAMTNGHTSFPHLQPIDSLLAQADAPSANPAPDLAARASALRARAARLSPPSPDSVAPNPASG